MSKKAMQYPSRIALWRANGELIARNDQPLSRVVLSSTRTKWNDIQVRHHHWLDSELVDVMHKQHLLCITVGHPTTSELKQEGRFKRFFNAIGSVSFFPSRQPYSLRLHLENGAFANILCLMVDPVFMSRIAEGLELNSDRVELVGQRRDADPVLRYIAMALRAGVQTGDALDPMYGESLSTALAVHLLHEYSAAAPTPKRPGELPRGKLVRAVQYIQDQLGTDLTVSGIAQTVGISPYYFTRLFKESTGLPPHQYVVEARVRKAKDLLTTGKFTISEAAQHVGFVDQSHLTRHFKRVFGLPPKALLKESFVSGAKSARSRRVSDPYPVDINECVPVERTSSI
jgi:AraC family transcriptional regulator